MISPKNPPELKSRQASLNASEENELNMELVQLKEKMAERQKKLCDKTIAQLSTGLHDIHKFKLKTRNKLKGHAAKVYSIYWAHGDVENPSSCQMLSASQDSTLIIWNTCTRRKLRAIELSCAWTMTCAMARPNNDLVASAGMDSAVSVYSLVDRQSTDSGRLVRELVGHDGFISALDFLHDNRILTASSDKTCILWDTATGSRLQQFQGHQSEIYCMDVGVVEDVNNFATGSADNSVKLWDLRVANSVFTLANCHDADVNSVSFFPSGKALATASDDCTAKLVDLRACQTVSTYKVPHKPNHRDLEDRDETHLPPVVARNEKRKSAPAISSVGKSSILGTAQVYKSAVDVSRMGCYQTHDTETPSLPISAVNVPITSVAFSSSGRLLFCGCDNFDCVVFDTFKQGSILEFLHGHENRVQCVGVDRAGRALATGSWDSTIRIWN